MVITNQFELKQVGAKAKWQSYMPLILEAGGSLEFKASLIFTEKPCLEKPAKQTNKKPTRCWGYRSVVDRASAKPCLLFPVLQVDKSNTQNPFKAVFERM